MDIDKIVDYFLTKIPIEAVESGEGIHTIKLQKLLFFAQEEYLYKYKKPLFDEPIEAWRHGPVVRKVWNKFRNEKIISAVPLSNNINIPDDVKSILDYVWALYGDKDEWYLRDLTHTYEIWKNKYQAPISNEIITIDEILDYKIKIEQAKKQAKKEALEVIQRVCNG